MNYNIPRATASMPDSPSESPPARGRALAGAGRRSVSRLTFAALQVFLTASALSFAAPADDFKDAGKLYQQGKLDQALTKTNAGLAVQPKDAQGRFLKGLILTEQKKINEAIQMFTGLTEDYPELPEPYNNLAVLYAGQGNYDKAKAALELAIHTHPAYATAHENLGDIYAQLARRAYDKALQLDKTNVTAQSKLAMVKEMFSVPKSTVVAAATPTPAPTATKPEAAKPAAPAASAAAAASTAASAPAASAPNKEPAASRATEDGVKSTVQAWAAAWAAKDVPAYLGYYAATFETPDGMARGAWEAQRRERIERPKSIKVDVTFKSVKIKGAEATVTFRQAYRSDNVNSNNTKTLKMVRAGDKWLIQTERSGG